MSHPWFRSGIARYVTLVLCGGCGRKNPRIIKFMGMFDTILIKYPLPEGGPPDAQQRDYQTKGLENALDLYELREDGTLWHEEYDIEDQSDAAKWRKEHPGEELPKELDGFLSFAGCMTRINKHWVQVADFTGEIRFYDCVGRHCSGWLEYSAYLVSGKVTQINFIKYRPEDPVREAEAESRIKEIMKPKET